MLSFHKSKDIFYVLAYSADKQLDYIQLLMHH